MRHFVISVEFNEERVQALELAVGDAAAALDVEPGPFRERDLEDRLQASLERQRPKRVHRQVSLKLDSWKGKLGPADLALEDDDGLALIEVKWGGAELAACSWDTVKLATALAEGQGQSAYLISGASQDDWRHSRLGAELFDTREWTLDGLLVRYEEWFAFWRRDVQNHPLRLASGWRVFEHEMSSFEEGGEVWDIRLAEIQIPEAELLPVDYAPVVARWKRGVTPKEKVVDEPRAAPTDISPIASESLPSREAAEAVAGPLERLGAGEGFSVELGSAHYVAANEGSMIDFADEDTARDLAEKPISLLQFKTPAARRAWLRERRQIKEPWPEVMRIEAGAGLGDSWRVRLESGRLRYRYVGFDSGSVEDVIKPGAQAWFRFWRALDRVRIWDWGPRYQPENVVTDGYGWDVQIARAGRMVIAAGYEAFPDRGDVRFGEESADWSDFLAAVRDLLGGLRVV